MLSLPILLKLVLVKTMVHGTNLFSQKPRLLSPSSSFHFASFPVHFRWSSDWKKGDYIRQIIQQTGASVKIMEETLFLDENPVRRVVINGVIDSLFKAQYLIYDKVVKEGRGPVDHQIDDIRLTVEMSVPTKMVGRLIGKARQNIRDIQKSYLCRVKFMNDPDDTLPPCNPTETYVRIIGNYNSFLGAQKKIRAILIKAMTCSFHGCESGRRNKDDSEPDHSPDASGSANNDSGNSGSGEPLTEEPVPTEQE